MFSTEIPQDFQVDSATKVAGCFILDPQSRILLLERHTEKSDPWKWWRPGWKIENQETPEEWVIREVREETSIIIRDPVLLADLYVKKYDDAHFVYSLYKFIMPHS